MNTVKPFATKTTTHMSDWNLETTLISPRLDLTIDDNDELNFEYRHKAGIEVKLGYSTDDGKNWKTLNTTKLTESASFKIKKVRLKSITQTNEFRIKFIIIDKAGRVIGARVQLPRSQAQTLQASNRKPACRHGGRAACDRDWAVAIRISDR